MLYLFLSRDWFKLYNWTQNLLSDTYQLILLNNCLTNEQPVLWQQASWERARLNKCYAATGYHVERINGKNAFNWINSTIGVIRIILWLALLQEIPILSRNCKSDNCKRSSWQRFRTRNAGNMWVRNSSVAVLQPLRILRNSLYTTTPITSEVLKWRIEFPFRVVLLLAFTYKEKEKDKDKALQTIVAET